jgi:putative transposase
MKDWKSQVLLKQDKMGMQVSFCRSFWARGYCVRTVGFDEHQIKQYIKEQEQLELDFD